MRMRGYEDMMSRGIVRSADMGIKKMDLGVEMRGYDVQGGLTLDKQIWGKKDGLGWGTLLASSGLCCCRQDPPLAKPGKYLELL